MYALRASDGAFKWKFQSGGKIDGFLSVSPDGQDMFFGDGDGYVNALEATTVKLKMLFNYM